jgi:hypothetical protein
MEINDGMYKDIKDGLKYVTNKIFKPYIENRNRKQILKSFSDDFEKDTENQTQIVDYYVWHEENNDWENGNGHLGISSYGELYHFWSVPNNFILYEAKLLRFIRNGGKINRLFLLGPEIGDIGGLWTTASVFKRHQALGFSPKVLSVLDLRHELKTLGVNCDMYGVLNGRIAYFLKFPLNAPPVMVRTENKKIIDKIENSQSRLWKNATYSESWIKKKNIYLPKEIIDQVNIHVSAISDISKTTSF